MGCCSSRNPLFDSSSKKTFLSYIENNNLHSLTCVDIKRLDAQILSDLINRPSYEMLAKGWNIQAPFELFAIRGIVKKFELKVSLIIFSRDSYDNKQKLLFEMIGNSSRNLMRFLE